MSVQRNARLRFVLQELLGDLPQSRDWLSPDVEREMRALHDELKTELGTPAAQWREKGEPDPHGNHYNGERAKLALGHLTDDELANAAFLHYDIRPPLQDIIDGKAHSPIAYMTAVKERIRWLSRALAAKTRGAA